MIGLGSTRVASGTRPLSPLTDGYRDDGFMIIGLGIADALVLMAVLHPIPYYWAWVISAAVFFAVGFVLLLERHEKWLTTAVETSVSALADAPTRRHLGAVQRGIPLVPLCGALTALSALAFSAILSHVLLVILPGIMVASGVRELVRAERVQSWERERDSELLVAAGWRRWHPPSYFVRSHSIRP